MSTSTEEYNPYCAKCGACGEDACCPANMCNLKDGDYCERYKQELKFGYAMYKEFYKLINEMGSEIMKERANEIFDERFDTFFE